MLLDILGGSNEIEADKVCNIYRLEGGLGEWTAEKNPNGYPCVARGGGASVNPVYPASQRWAGMGASDQYNTFRMVLYVM